MKKEEERRWAYKAYFDARWAARPYNLEFIPSDPDLWLMVRTMPEAERIELAGDPNTPRDILFELSRYHRSLQKIVLDNPSAGEKILLHAVKGIDKCYLGWEHRLKADDSDVMYAVLRHPNVSDVILQYIWDKIVSIVTWEWQAMFYIVCELVEHPKTPKEIMEHIWERGQELQDDKKRMILYHFAESASSTVKLLKKVAKQDSQRCNEIWCNPRCTASLRIWLIKEFPFEVRSQVEEDPKSSSAELELLWNTAKEKDDPFFFKWVMMNHPNTPPHIREEAMNY